MHSILVKVCLCNREKKTSGSYLSVVRLWEVKKNSFRRCGTHTHTLEYYWAIKKNTCSNMDGLGGHSAKWNKPDRERQILYDITYMWNLKIQWKHEYNKKEAGWEI